MKMLRLTKLRAAWAGRIHSQFTRPGLAVAAFGTSDDKNERKWREFTHQLKDALAQRGLSRTYTNVVLESVEASEELKSAVKRDLYPTTRLVDALASVPKSVQFKDSGGIELHVSIQPERASPRDTLSQRIFKETADIEMTGPKTTSAEEVARRYQCEKHTEPVVAVEPGFVDEVYRGIDDLGDSVNVMPSIVEFVVLVEARKKFAWYRNLQVLAIPPPADRPDLGVRVALPFFCVPLVGELGCRDLNEGVARVLARCEADPAVVGIVSAVDKWVFIRRRDGVIFKDDDPVNNKLLYDGKGRLDPVSMERIAGKLHSLLDPSA